MKYSFIFFLCSATFCLGQNYTYVTQTQVNQTQITNNNLGPSTYAVNAFLNVYRDLKMEKMAKEEAQAKLNLLRQNYDSYESYPDSISTGWHNVIVTDNLKFCRDAKVYVDHNKILEFVIDNCIRLNFTAAGLIKKGKNVVTINNFNGEQIKITDVYFIYDLDGPVLTNPPINPGYVCFWTSKKKYLNNDIIIENIAYGGLTSLINTKTNPTCGQKGTVTIELKPGKHSLTALASGNDLDGSIEIKSDQCLLFKLD